ncbi:MAG TPA: hypothetical protein VHY35_16920 [Stellaceae bacterium]|nr:hypothetical protein [Stellaceae bacterium]
MPVQQVIEETALDPNDAASGDTTDRQETIAQPPHPNVSEVAAAGEAGITPESDGTTDEGVSSGGSPGDAAPRRRRRRRRRRPPGEGGMAAAQEAGPVQTDAADMASDDGEAGSGAEPGEATDNAVEAEGGGAAEGAAPGGGELPRGILRLRSRRRRRRPHGLLPGAAVIPAVAEGATPPAAEGAEGEAVAAAAAPTPAPGLAPGQRSFSAPRRRRRHAPLSGAPAGGEEAAGGAATGEQPAGDGAPRSPRRRNRRRRPGAAAGEGAEQRTGEAGAADQRDRHPHGERGDGARADRSAAPSGEGRRDNRRGDGRRDRRDGPGGRGGARNAAPRQVERKLYNIDAVVDRGFEDIEAEAEGDTEARRVHWAIVKRTVADQVTRKPVSTLYVLQRDGADAEFPTLGAARSAVNKNIVHPEKLTLSKAEHAAAKK